MSEKHEQKLVPDPKDRLGTDENQQQADTDERTRNEKSRRKFLKGAVAATPVILTVANRPVWARNCSLSGQLSGNLSDQNDPPCGGEGCGVNIWAASSFKFHPKFPPTMFFDDAFNTSAFPYKTLLDVVQMNLTNQDINVPAGCTPTSVCRTLLGELGAEAVAALQNSASPLKYDLDVPSVIASFQKSYKTGSEVAYQDTLTAFRRYNNQFCPLN